ncbi:hypothetical protein [Maridesulfovibrio sp.]|uniref:hypothetical protein n=1 Tax=Maridesulfovibrio sp. TaxID=2795000 RepID=UPI002A18AAD4|nr:hypothetical protein [Maridesulfovibrio sp.]
MNEDFIVRNWDLLVGFTLGSIFTIVCLGLRGSVVTYWKKFPYKAKIIVASLLVLLFSLFLLFLSKYKTDSDVYAWFLSTLAAIFISGSVMSLLSELFFKEQLQKEINDTVFNNFEINKSIQEFSLSRIDRRWSIGKTIERILESRDCIVIGLYNKNIVEDCQNELRKHLVKNKVTMVMIDPEHENAIAYLDDKFSKDGKLKELIEGVARTSFDFKKELNEHGKNFIIKKFKYIVTYSAYLFDEKEIWIIPNTSLPEKFFLPVLVFKFTGSEINNSPFFVELNRIVETSQELKELSSPVGGESAGNDESS